MNVIVYRYNSISEPGYITAFRTLGLNVRECRRTDGNMQIYDRMEKLAALIRQEKPLFVFSINYFPFISMVCEKLRTIYLAVSVDCPVFEIYDMSVRSPYNRIFLFDRAQYFSVRDENPRGVFHLPLGADVKRIEENVGVFDVEGTRDFEYDVSFVGSLYSEKDSYSALRLPRKANERFLSLMGEQAKRPGLGLIEKSLTEEDLEILRLADPGFRPSDRSVCDISKSYAVDSYFCDHLTVKDRSDLMNTLAAALPKGSLHLFTLSDTSGLTGVVCHDGVNSSTQMPLVFRRSRININHTMRAIRTGLPQRIWDVLGSGGFLLTNAQEEIPDYLNPGEHLEVYTDNKELIEKVHYYLDNEDERCRIALAGYMEVKERHTVLHRVAEMIRLIVTGEGSAEDRS